MKLAIVLAATVAATAALSAPFPVSTLISTPTTPSYQTMKLTLQPGASSASIAVPAVNRPVHMMIAVSTSDDRGVGEATIMRTKPATVLTWAGVDYATNTGASSQVSAGAAKNAGRHIVYADAGGFVDVEVENAENIKVHNGSTAVQTAVLTFIW